MLVVSGVVAAIGVGAFHSAGAIRGTGVIAIERMIRFINILYRKRVDNKIIYGIIRNFLRFRKCFSWKYQNPLSYLSGHCES